MEPCFTGLNPSTLHLYTVSYRANRKYISIHFTLFNLNVIPLYSILKYIFWNHKNFAWSTCPMSLCWLFCMLVQTEVGKNTSKHIWLQIINACLKCNKDKGKWIRDYMLSEGHQPYVRLCKIYQNAQSQMFPRGTFTTDSTKHPASLASACLHLLFPEVNP